MAAREKVVLGLHIGHDRGAAIASGGTIITAIAEERLDRVKHSKADKLPILSINYVLKEAKLKPKDLDLVVLTHSGGPINTEVCQSWQREVSDLLKITEEKVYLLGHHLAHAYSAFYTSPFTDAAIAVADGGGDVIAIDKHEAESYYTGSRNKGITLVHSRYQQNTIKYGTDLCGYRHDYLVPENRRKQISLGKKYEQITYLIGFGFGQAGKTMGLAPYGRHLIKFRVPVSGLDINLTYGDYLDKLHSVYVRGNQPYSEFIKKNQDDIAYDIQNSLTETLVKLMGNLQVKTQQKNLCLAGGVFLNSVANHQILQRSGFDNVYIVPPAGDDGEAIGAALWGSTKILKCASKVSYFSPYLGREYSGKENYHAIQRTRHHYRHFNQNKVLAKKVASIINKGYSCWRF